MDYGTLKNGNCKNLNFTTENLSVKSYLWDFLTDTGPLPIFHQV